MGTVPTKLPVCVTFTVTFNALATFWLDCTENKTISPSVASKSPTRPSITVNPSEISGDPCPTAFDSDIKYVQIEIASIRLEVRKKLNTD